MKTEVQGTSCEAGGSTCVPVKLFVGRKERKGKERKITSDKVS